MLPRFNPRGNLPPGAHRVTWKEFEIRFGFNHHRRKLIEGLRGALLALRQAGCHTAYVNGSFVTAKEVPGDFDVCWDPEGVDGALLDPVLLDFSNKRAAQKAKYGGELFPSGNWADPAGNTFLEFFQIDKATGEPKGIVVIDLRTESL